MPHRGPFDRLLIAQAAVEDLMVLTVDRATEFCPLKNAPGSETDAPGQCRETISRLSLQSIRAVSSPMPSVAPVMRRVFAMVVWDQ